MLLEQPGLACLHQNGFEQAIGQLQAAVGQGEA
jgi:hypothetical protein